MAKLHPNLVDLADDIIQTVQLGILEDVSFDSQEQLDAFVAYVVLGIQAPEYKYVSCDDPNHEDYGESWVEA